MIRLGSADVRAVLPACLLAEKQDQAEGLTEKAGGGEMGDRRFFYKSAGYF